MKLYRIRKSGTRNKEFLRKEKTIIERKDETSVVRTLHNGDFENAANYLFCCFYYMIKRRFLFLYFDSLFYSCSVQSIELI